MEQGRYKIDENLNKKGGKINVVIIDKETCATLLRGYPRNIPNLVTMEQVSIPPDLKVYNMIDQLKNTPSKISLYDLISTFQAHRDVLYALFKYETILTNILNTTFFRET